MNAAGVIVLMAVAGLLLVLALADRTQVGGRPLSLLRVLFPSWRFFETVEPPPGLWCRVASAQQALGEFQPVLPLPARSPLSWLVNPRGNLLLACYSLLEQLESELDLPDGNPTDTTQASVTSELIDRWVRELTRELAPEATDLRYQWLLTRREDGRTLFMSEVRPVVPKRGQR